MEGVTSFGGVGPCVLGTELPRPALVGRGTSAALGQPIRHTPFASFLGLPEPTLPIPMKEDAHPLATWTP